MHCVEIANLYGCVVFVRQKAHHNAGTDFDSIILCRGLFSMAKEQTHTKHKQFKIIQSNHTTNVLFIWFYTTRWRDYNSSVPMPIIWKVIAHTQINGKQWKQQQQQCKIPRIDRIDKYEKKKKKIQQEEELINLLEVWVTLSLLSKNCV